MTHEDELLEFLLEEAGGRKQALLRFHRRQVVELASMDTTVKELLDTAEAEGWLDWLRGLKVSDLANIVNPPEELERPGTAPAKAAARLTGAQREELHSRIFEYLKQHPKSGAADIAAAVGWAPVKLASHLFKLKREGRLAAEGERRNTRYSLPADAPKAVPPIRRKK